MDLAIKHIDTCMPDTFAGSPLPIIGIPVDARVTVTQMVNALSDLDEWPTDLSVAAIKEAIDHFAKACGVGNSQPMFPDAYPEELPGGFRVEQHPVISNIWLVVDDKLRVIDRCRTYGEAVCVAWEAESIGSAPTEEPIHAYFEMHLAPPEGYSIDFFPRNTALDEARWKYARDGIWSSARYGTEFDAVVAAWLDAESPHPA